MRLVMVESKDRQSLSLVMAGLDPAIHLFYDERVYGCLGQARA